jgi:hypothetical protein
MKLSDNKTGESDWKKNVRLSTFIDRVKLDSSTDNQAAEHFARENGS